MRCFKFGQLHFFTASNSTLKFVSCAKVWNPDVNEVYSPKEFESEEDEGGVGLHDTLCGQSLEQVLFLFRMLMHAHALAWGSASCTNKARNCTRILWEYVSFHRTLTFQARLRRMIALRFPLSTERTTSTTSHWVAAITRSSSLYGIGVSVDMF